MLNQGAFVNKNDPNYNLPCIILLVQNFAAQYDKNNSEGAQFLNDMKWVFQDEEANETQDYCGVS